MATTFLGVKNNANSSLLATLTSGGTLLNLLASEGAKFPLVAPFHITIENEIIKVGGVSGDQFSPLTRAQEGTTAVEHGLGAQIKLLVTAQQISDIHAAIKAIEDNLVVATRTADYLVGTAQADLPNEIVAGPTPQGELGGSWSAPIVDSQHSGSGHHDPLHPLGSHSTKLHSELSDAPEDAHHTKIHNHTGETLRPATLTIPNYIQASLPAVGLEGDFALTTDTNRLWVFMKGVV